jgi:hypothetical protein
MQERARLELQVLGRLKHGDVPCKSEGWGPGAWFVTEKGEIC